MTWVAVIHAPARSRTSASTPMSGFVRRSERSARPDLELARRVLRPVDTVARAERRFDEGREVLDVGAHDDDVAQFELRVGLEQPVQDRIAQDLDLARPPVARMDADAVVAVRQQRARVGLGPEPAVADRQPVGAHVVLDPAQQRVRPRFDLGGVTPVRDRAAQDELHFAGVAAPRREQRVVRHGRRRILPAEEQAGHRADLGRQSVPQHGRRVQQEEVHVASGPECLEHVEVAGRQPGEPEQREAVGKVHQAPVLAQLLARLAQSLGGAGRSDPVAQAQPEIDLPRRLGPLAELRRPVGPALQHVGPVHGVAVEEVRHMADARKALRLLHRPRLADVLGQRGEPLLVEVPLHQLHQRPHGAVGRPGVGVRVGVGGHGQCTVHQHPGEREDDVGAHAVVPPFPGAELTREPLGQPPLDPTSRHGYHLGLDRVVEGDGHQLGQLRHQFVGPIGAVDVQHPCRVRRRCSPGTGPETSNNTPGDTPRRVASAGPRRLRVSPAGARAASRCSCPRAADKMLNCPSPRSSSSSGSTAWRWRGALSIGGNSVISARSLPTTPRAGNLPRRARTRDSSEPTALL